VTQPVKVSEFLETRTIVTAAPSADKPKWVDWLGRKAEAKSTTVYETVTKRAMVPYNQCGPLAVHGWEGSGLCDKCAEQADGSQSQLVDVVECKYGVNKAGKQYSKCAEWYETWIQRPAPTSTVTANARCSSQGKVPSAGTYTWTFPQTAPPVTITAPARTQTITVGGRWTTSIQKEKVYTIPGQPWNAYVTKHFSSGTSFNFNVYITKVLVFNIPHDNIPAGR
jgi:hypothetical protein